MINKQFYIFGVLFITSNVAGDPSYSAMLMALSECEDFKNEHIRCDGIVMEMAENGKGMTIGGYIEVVEEIDEEFEFSLSVVKETENGNQPMFSAASNMCQAIKDEDAPWAPICKSMNMTYCPIKRGKYYVSEVTVNLDNADSIMTRDNCGDYNVEANIMFGPEKKACMSMGLAIDEVNSDDE